MMESVPFAVKLRYLLEKVLPCPAFLKRLQRSEMGMIFNEKIEWYILSFMIDHICENEQYGLLME